MTVAVVLLGIAVALLGALVISMLRSHAEILRVLNDMGIDLDPAVAPSTFSLAGATTTPVTAADTAPGVPGPGDALGRTAADIVGVAPAGDAVVMGVSGEDTLLAFLSSGCSTCMRFWSAFADAEVVSDGQLADGTRVVIVTRGEEAESPRMVAELSPLEVSVIMSSDAWEDYGVPVAPYFAMVRGNTVVGEGAAAEWPQVRDLLARAQADREHHGAEVGGADSRRSRRSLITGNRERIDAELIAAGIHPGDPRLVHRPEDVGLEEPGDDTTPER